MAREKEPGGQGANISNGVAVEQLEVGAGRRNEDGERFAAKGDSTRC